MSQWMSVFLTAAVIAGLTGCGSKPAPEASAPSQAQTETAKVEESQSTKTFTIGFSVGDLSGQFPKNFTEAFEAKAKENPDIVYKIQDARGDIANQISQIENFITEKVDVIILQPFDTEALNDVVIQANEAGIPVIQINTRTTGGEYTYIGSNDYDAGVMQGEFFKDKLPENAKICLMLGTLGHSGQTERSRGWAESILKERPDIEVLAEQSGNWQRAQGMTMMEDWLQNYPQIDAVLSQNDEMIMGALEAIKASGRESEIMTCGVDAIPDALQAVKDGVLTMTVFQDAKGQGEQAYQCAMMVRDGKTLEAEYMIPFIAITEENAADFETTNQ